MISLSLGTGDAIMFMLAVGTPVTALRTSFATMFWINEYPF